MVTREDVLVELQKVPEKYLEELYRIIKDFEEKSDEDQPGKNIMAALREIKISASSNYSTKVTLYDVEEKDAQ